MRILLVHNAYQHSGGEDSVVESEIALLRAHGHEVAEYRRHNDEITSMSKPMLAMNTLWSGRSGHEVERQIKMFRPDVIHAHNTFPLISPSMYWAAERAGVPVVQTLHNFRMMCLNAMFLRAGKVCEDCSGRLPWRGIVRQCYRASTAQSAVLAGMLVMHRSLGTYRNKVARYIALNDFCRSKFIAGGLPAERIVVKPNFVEWADARPCSEPASGGKKQSLLFVGRLSTEKGIETLAGAATLLPDLDMRVAGEGPQAHLLEDALGITRLGNLPSDVVHREMNAALALVLPSIWYENFPRTLVEAFACGLPVIASRIGALADLVREGETGLLFEPGDARDLADKLAWAMAHPEAMMEMGRKARAQYEAEFSPEVNYRLLMDIYNGVLAERGEAS